MSMTQPGAGKVSAEASLKDFLTTPGGESFRDNIQSHMSGLQLETKRLSSALKTRGVEADEADKIAVGHITGLVQQAATEAVKVQGARIR